MDLRGVPVAEFLSFCELEETISKLCCPEPESECGLACEVESDTEVLGSSLFS